MIEYLQRLPFSTIVLVISLILATLETWETRRRWRTLRAWEQVKGCVTAASLFLVAAFTSLDGARVDGLIGALKAHIIASDATIAQEKTRTDIAEKRLSLVSSQLRNDERQLGFDRNAITTATQNLANASDQLGVLRTSSALLARNSAATAVQARRTQAQVTSEGRFVARLSAETAKHLHAIDLEQTTIAAKAGVYHLSPSTIQAIANIITGVHGSVQIVCVPGVESVCADFDQLFINAHWKPPLVLRGQSLFGSNISSEQHGIFVWYHSENYKKIAEAITNALAGSNLDAVIRDDSNDPGATDLRITVIYVER
jgi:hypothetical protein